MFERILTWLWIRINIFSSRKHCPNILIPFAGRLMLILSHGIAWFHRKQNARIMAHHIQRAAQILIRYHCWRYRDKYKRDYRLIFHPFGPINGNWRINEHSQQD